MDRRTFIERFLPGLALTGVLMLVGCSKEERSAAFGNEEKLWQIASGEIKAEEPLVLGYTSKTPALYRDASMGKPDPSFVPKVSGG